MWTMSVAGIVQRLCAIPVCLATSKNCVSGAGDSRRFAASSADIVDWAPNATQLACSLKQAPFQTPQQVGMRCIESFASVLE